MVKVCSMRPSIGQRPVQGCLATFQKARDSSSCLPFSLPINQSCLFFPLPFIQLNILNHFPPGIHFPLLNPLTDHIDPPIHIWPTSQTPPLACRCLEEEGSLLDLEGLSSFPKGLDGLRKAAGDEQHFDVKDIFNTSLESETLKETLYRQAKTQVCESKT